MKTENNASIKQAILNDGAIFRYTYTKNVEHAIRQLLVEVCPVELLDADMDILSDGRIQIDVTPSNEYQRQLLTKFHNTIFKSLFIKEETLNYN